MTMGSVFDSGTGDYGVPVYDYAPSYPDPLQQSYEPVYEPPPVWEPNPYEQPVYDDYGAREYAMIQAQEDQRRAEDAAMYGPFAAGPAGAGPFSAGYDPGAAGYMSMLEQMDAYQQNPIPYLDPQTGFMVDPLEPLSLRERGIESGAIRGDLGDTALGRLPGQALGAVGDVAGNILSGIGEIPLYGAPTPNAPVFTVGDAAQAFNTPYPYNEQVANIFGDVSARLGQAGTYAIPALGSADLLGLNVPEISRTIGEDVLAPRSYGELALTGALAAGGVASGLRAGEGLGRAAVRGLAEGLLTDPTTPGGLARGVNEAGAGIRAGIAPFSTVHDETVFKVGDYTVAFKGDPNLAELTVYRSGLPQKALTEDISHPGGSIAGLRQLGAFLEDVRNLNPNLEIEAWPGSERRADIFQALMPFQKDPEYGALRLTLPPSQAPEAGGLNRLLTEETGGVTLPNLTAQVPLPTDIAADLASRPSAYDKAVRIGEAHLDNLDLGRRIAETLGDVPILQNIIKMGNTSALAREEPVLRTFFEYKNLEAIQAAERDSVLARIPNAPERFRAGNDGMVTVEQMNRGPVRVAFGDVATKPDNYVLTADERAWIQSNWDMIDAKRARVDDLTAQAHARNIPIRGIDVLPFGPDEHYWPRFTVDDGRLSVGGGIGREQGVEKARFFEDQTVGIQKGIDYVSEPKRQLDLYMAALDKRERDIVYQMRLDDLHVGRVPAGGLKQDEPNMGRIFSPEETRRIQQQTGTAPKALDIINLPSVLSRMMVTGLGDAGTFALQLATTLDHPAIFTESGVRGLLNVFSDQEGRLLRSAKGQEAAKYGALGGKNEYYEYAGAKNILGKAYDIASYPARSIFDGSIQTARTLLFDSLAGLARKHPDFAMNPAKLDEELYRIGRFVQTMTGGTNTQTLGLSKTNQGIESLFAFAPRYTRSGPGLAAHALHGGITGAEAKKSLMTWVLGGMAISAGAAYEGSGGDWKAVKDSLDPTKNFMGWRDGENNVGIGGIIRAMIKTAGQIGDDPKSLMETNSKDNPLLNFARSRTSPLVGSIVDIATGKDFIGRPVPNDLKGIIKDPTELLDYLRTKVTPFTIEAYLEAKGDTIDQLKGAAASAVGLRSSPAPGWVLEREGLDEVTRNPEKFNLDAIMPPGIAAAVRGQDYDGLSSRERAELRMLADPGLRERADKEGRERDSAFQKWEDTRTKITEDFQPKLSEAAYNLSIAAPADRYAARLAIKELENEMKRQLQEVPYPGKEGDPAKMSDIQRLERVYNGIYDMVPPLPDGKPNWDEITRLQQAVLAKTMEQDVTLAGRLAYTTADRVRPTDHEVLQELDAVKPLLAELAAIPNTLPDGKPDYGWNKDQWYRERPEENARLAYLGYAPELHSFDAINQYRTQHPDSPLPNVNLYSGPHPGSGRATKMEIDYFGLPPGKPNEPSYKDQVRRAVPELDVNLWRHGYANEIKSLAAWERLTPQERVLFTR